MINLTNKEAIAIVERIAKTTNEGSPADVLDAMKALDPIVTQFFDRSCVKEAVPNWDKLRGDMQKAHTVEVLLAVDHAEIKKAVNERIRKHREEQREKMQQKKSPWIPVNGPVVPEDGQKVLAMWLDPTDGVKFSGTAFYMNGFLENGFKALAWMPIPEYDGEVR